MRTTIRKRFGISCLLLTKLLKVYYKFMSFSIYGLDFSQNFQILTNHIIFAATCNRILQNTAKNDAGSFAKPPAPFKFQSIFQRIQIIHITHHHQGYFKGKCVVKGTNIQSGALLQLLNPVHQRISMYKELPRRL